MYVFHLLIVYGMMCSVRKYLESGSELACSEERFILTELNGQNEETCILSEISMLKSEFTKQFDICHLHRNIVTQNIKNRQRRKLCNVSSYSDAFIVHKSKKVGDRQLTADMSHSVAVRTGIFIPVGTRMYTRGKKKLCIMKYSIIFYIYCSHLYDVHNR
jgi:hypothetical protein